MLKIRLPSKRVCWGGGREVERFLHFENNCFWLWVCRSSNSLQLRGSATSHFFKINKASPAPIPSVGRYKEQRTGQE